MSALVETSMLLANQMAWHLATKVHRSTRDTPLNFSEWPFLIGLYHDQAPTKVAMSSTQSAKSEWLIVATFAWAILGASVFYVLPTQPARNTFVGNRIDGAIRRQPLYERLLGLGGRRRMDDKILKHLGRGSAKFVGCNTHTEMKEFPADVLVVDELDECDPTNLRFAEDRLGASRLQVRYYVGNPTVRSQGIGKLYYEGSDRRRWFVTCPACGERQPLAWRVNFVSERSDDRGNVLGAQKRREDLLPVCRACDKGVLERLGEGEWISEAPERSEIAGYHISRWMVPTTALARSWERYERALGSDLLMQAFVNSEEGEPFTAAGVKITPDLLDRLCNRGYLLPAGLPDHHPCTAGVDVGAWLDVRISDYPPVDRGKKPRRCVFAGKVSSDEELIGLFRQKAVKFVVFDAEPEVERVRRLAQQLRELGIAVWRCRYARSEGWAIRELVLDESEHVVSIDRTALLDAAYNDLSRGNNWLPKAWQELADGRYADEMCELQRTLEQDTHGRFRYRWIGEGADHQRHADGYDYLASQLAGMTDATFDLRRALPNFSDPRKRVNLTGFTPARMETLR